MDTTSTSAAGRRTITLDTYQTVFPEIALAAAEATAAMLKPARV